MADSKGLQYLRFFLSKFFFVAFSYTINCGSFGGYSGEVGAMGGRGGSGWGIGGGGWKGRSLWGMRRWAPWLIKIDEGGSFRPVKQDNEVSIQLRQH